MIELFASATDEESREKWEMGFRLLAEEAKDWWRSVEVLHQAIRYVIGRSGEEEDG